MRVASVVRLAQQNGDAVVDQKLRLAIEQGACGLTVTETISWKRRASGNLIAHLNLKSTSGHRLVLTMQIKPLQPSAPVAFIRDHGAHPNSAFRLCVRGRHVNRSSDGKIWLPGTHLHQYRTEHGDRHAIDPLPPWPPNPWDEGSPGEVQAELLAVFRRFCLMMHIHFDESAWVTPELTPQTVTLPDGDEIP